MDDLARVREIYMGLPEVEERLSHGSPAWFYKGKRCLGMFADHHHGVDWVALWVPCLPGVAAGLVESQTVGPLPQSLPGGEGGHPRFFIPPYVGVKGWVGVRLDAGVDWDEVRGLVEGAWEVVTGKSLG